MTEPPIPADVQERPSALPPEVRIRLRGFNADCECGDDYVCENCQVLAAAYLLGLSQLDRILDGLQRRMERREKQRQAVEAVYVKQTRGGALPDPRVRTSYLVADARWNEARLACNAALEIDKLTRHTR